MLLTACQTSEKSKILINQQMMQTDISPLKPITEFKIFKQPQDWFYFPLLPSDNSCDACENWKRLNNKRRNKDEEFVCCNSNEIKIKLATKTVSFASPNFYHEESNYDSIG